MNAMVGSKVPKYYGSKVSWILSEYGFMNTMGVSMGAGFHEYLGCE